MDIIYIDRQVDTRYGRIDRYKILKIHGYIQIDRYKILEIHGYIQIRRYKIWNDRQIQDIRNTWIYNYIDTRYGKQIGRIDIQ